MFELPPVSVPYTIRVDKAFHTADPPAGPTIYDIPVALDDTLRTKLNLAFGTSSHAPTIHQLSRLDEQLALTVQGINHAKAKHGFLTSMSKDPANFTKRWIKSQKRDLDVVIGAGTSGVEDWQDEEFRKGGDRGAWGTTQAMEGVSSYLYKQSKTAGA